MPNNTVFSKKNLGFFLFLGVFCIGTTLNHLAYAVDSANFRCSCISDTGFDQNDGNCTIYQGIYDYSLTGNTPEERCKSVQGCKWDSFAGCSLGSQNSYTDYTVQNCEQTSSCIKPCPSPYTKSANGSWTENQCYKDVNCAGETEATASTTDPKKCRIYHSGKVVCTSTTDTPNCLGTWGSDSFSNNICDLNQASVEGFTNNDEGNLLSYDYHREIQDGNHVCYSNTRACTLFNYRKASENTDVSHSASGNNDVIITGNAQWYNSYWEVYGCYKKENGETISNENCTGVTIAQASNGNDDIHNVKDVLVYYDSPQRQNNNTNCPSCWKYRCTSCLAGHELYRNVQGQYSSCQGDDVIICGCAETAQGYYSTGGDFCDYNFNGTIFNNNDFADNFCPSPSENYVHPCLEPGMTSNGGATSDDECHYGSGDAGTQFCDAFGCVYLDNLTFNDNSYSWNGDVHLVGVLYEENRNYMCPDATPTPRYFWGYDKDGNPINAQGNIVDNCRRN